MDWLADSGRLAGLLLVLSAVAGVLLTGPSATVPAAIWSGPAAVTLPLIAQHPVIWRMANIGFVVATILTAAGLWLLPEAVGVGGAALARAATVAFVLACALWLVTLAIRLLITPAVAATVAAGGTIDPAFEPLARLGVALFVAFIVIGGGSLVALGGAILLGGSISAVAGWVTVAFGVGIVGSQLVLGDTLPAFVYMPTTVIGIVLLLAAR